MEQKLVYLHTTKELAETEEILKQQGMQIFFKSEDAEINFSDMTEEEKSSWLESMRGDIKEQIRDLANGRQEYDSIKKLIEEKFDDILTLVNDDRIYNVDEKFKKLVKEMSTIDQLYYSVGEWKSCVQIDHSTYSQAKLRCSILIAKQGPNLVRYVAFLNDPILSLEGSTADTLKFVLEKKF